MDINKLYIGQIIPNYRKLCKILDIKIVDGSSKACQMKELERYFKYHKSGNKIIIDEIYLEPLPKIDGRGKEDVLNELSLIELKRHRKELNIKVVDTINTNTWNVYYKQIKEYDEKLMDFLLNDRPAIGKYTEGQFTGFKLRDDFPEIQMELCDYLIKLPD